MFRDLMTALLLHVCGEWILYARTVYQSQLSLMANGDLGFTILSPVPGRISLGGGEASFRSVDKASLEVIKDCRLLEAILVKCMRPSACSPAHPMGKAQ